MGDGRADNIGALLRIAEQMYDIGYQIYFAANPYYQKEIEESHCFEFIPVGDQAIEPARQVHPDPWDPRCQEPEALKAIEKTLYAASDAVKKKFPDLQNPGFDAIVHDHQTVAAVALANLYHRPNFPTFDSPHNFCYSAKNTPKIDDSLGVAALRKLPTPLLRWMALTWFRMERDQKFLEIINKHRVAIGTHQVSSYYEQSLTAGRAQLGLFPNWFAPAERSWGRNFNHFTPPGSTASSSGNEAIIDFIRGWEGKTAEQPIAWISDGIPSNADRQLELAARLSEKTDRPVILTGDCYPERGTLSGNRVLAIREPELAGWLGKCCVCVNNGEMRECVAALAASVPQIIIPREGAQHDTAERFARFGLGRVLPLAKVNPDNCADLIGRIDLDSGMFNNVYAYSWRLRTGRSGERIGRFIHSEIGACCGVSR